MENRRRCRADEHHGKKPWKTEENDEQCGKKPRRTEENEETCYLKQETYGKFHGTRMNLIVADENDS